MFWFEDSYDPLSTAALHRLAESFAVLAVAAAIPFGLGWLLADGAFRVVRREVCRRLAGVDRAFAALCAGRLRALEGQAPSVWRRELRALRRDRERIEAERDRIAFSNQPGAAAHRAKARARRATAWNAWFDDLEARVAGSAESAGAVAGSPAPFRRGPPIRKLCSFSVSPPPTADALREQYAKARGRGRVEEKIRLGSMLLDAEATVDSSLVRNEDGEIVGRKGGLREWIDETCPELSKHYAALMGYRRLAAEFRDEAGLSDPAPAALLLATEATVEKKLPPALRARLPALRKRARKRLSSPEAVTVKSFEARLLRAPPAAFRRRLA